MIQITKRRQIIQVGSQFSLSELGQEERSRIKSIVTTSNGPPISWSPDSFFNPFSVLSPGKSYIVFSVWSGGSFGPYSIPADAASLPSQNDRIESAHQFFTYRGVQNFGLVGLSQEAKSKIKVMWTEGNLPESDLLIWRPDSLFNPFNSFVPERTYFIWSDLGGSSGYNLGVPAPASESSSSSSAEPDESLSFLDDSLLPDIGLIPQDYIGA